MRSQLQLVAFALLYDRGAQFYDHFTRWLFLGEWEHWQETALSELPIAGLVVELGSGTGRLASVAATPERQWLGIERSPAMVRMARRRERTNANWTALADATALPLGTEVADAVVATFPSSYIFRPTTAAEIRRVLKPGGRVVIVLSGELAAHGWSRRWRRHALRLFYGKRRSAEDEREPLPFQLDGFAGRQYHARTRHGVAEVYVGRAPSGNVGSSRGCSQRLDGVAEREPAPPGDQG